MLRSIDNPEKQNHKRLLNHEIKLCIEGRVILRANLNTDVGLVNGAIGIVDVDFTESFKNKTRNASTRLPLNVPVIILKMIKSLGNS